MAHANDSGHAQVGHVVPVRTLVGVLLALLVLTVVTVAVTLVDLGPLNLAVAMGIALIKGALVLLYFMHLRWDRPFNAVIMISALAFVVIFIGLTLMDSYNYQADIIPGFGSQAQ